VSTVLIHRPGDVVGVATSDLRGGDRVTGRSRDRDEEVVVSAVDDVPLGHKLALRDIAAGEEVVEYGVAIGIATRDIAAGQHVHVHNLKGQRWA
jgi:(2R)-sulfolactate sulfo-lyase subunit alpha